MFSKSQCAVLLLFSVAVPQCLVAQNAVIRATVFPDHPVKVVTPFGEAAVAVTSVQSSPQLLIVIAKDTLTDDDYSEVRRFIASLYKSLHGDTTIKIATLRQTGGPDLAGPFRTQADLQAQLRKLTPDADSLPHREPVAFINSLTENLDPDSSPWSATLIVGRIPDFELTDNPAISLYAAAWLARQAISQKRSLLFHDVTASTAPQWAVYSAKATGGIVLGTADDSFSPSPQLVAASWDTPRPKIGFDLQMTSISGLSEMPNLALPSLAGRTATVPSIAEYIELLGLVEGLKSDPTGVKARLDRALAINPADRNAVQFGLDFATKNADVEGQVGFLTTALDLGLGDNAPLATRLGHLYYSRKNFAPAETALLQARELGVKDARSAEELGRIKLDKHDQVAAAEFIDESLTLNPAQQDLWFVTADLAKELNRAQRRTEALERALALGGHHVDRRVELIRIYLGSGDRANAARHADLQLPTLPADPDTQATWAGFYEVLDRPLDALACWKRVIDADPKRESANIAYSSILYNQGRFPEALAAAEHGLETDAGSAHLELTKVNSLEHLNRIYELRLSLDAFPGSDISVLRRRAEIADAFGGDAPAAWRRYAEARLKEPPKSEAEKADLEATLARGWRVCLREGDLTAADWFKEQMREPGKKDPQAAASRQKIGVWIPGGFDALAFVAKGHPGARPAAFMVEYCRTLVSHFSSGSPKEHELYQKAISTYFEQLSRLIAMSTRNGDRAVLTLSVANKQAQNQTETVLNMFGWKLRRPKDQIAIESGVKTGQSEKQDLASALDVDQGAMQAAFRSGKPFSIEIRFEWAPIVLDEETWRLVAQTDHFTGGLAESLSQHPDVARVYQGLSNVDPESATVLAYKVGFQLLQSRAQLISLYSSALAIGGGRVMAPGGAAADSVWTRLCGASPADPARFYRALIEKDNGKLFAWFFALSQLDSAHQRFFTRNENRAAEFYTAFTQSEDLSAGAARLIRKGTFTEFLREIPLDNGSVDFPGSAEVWMIAQGRSKASSRTDNLLKKVRNAIAPELEDRILLRLAQTRTVENNETFSELDNFLAVVHISEHRRSGPGGADRALDDESALLLAQNYNEFSSFYPYLGAFRELTTADLKTLFDFFGRLRTTEPVDTDLILRQFYALTEATRLAMEFGGMPETKANQIFRVLCSRFQSAPDIAGITSASLDTLRDITGNARGAADPDRALRSALLGAGSPVDFEWHGVPVSLDSAQEREKAFGRVLDLQKVPSAALLLRIDETVRRIAATDQPSLETITVLEKDLTVLPAVEIPKNMKLEGHVKTSLMRMLPTRMPQIAAELRQKAAKKKVNPEEIRKLCHEILTELGPQTAIALQGVIYAVYFTPEAIVIADDPLLVRKHQAFELSASVGKRNRFIRTAFNAGSTGEGSFFDGGFAQFAAESARAVLPESGASANLYVNQVASIKSTPWLTYRDDDQRLLGLRIRMVKEWCVYAADNPVWLSALTEDSLGILSLTRRRAFLNGIAARDWESVWAAVTISDLLFLADRYAARYAKSPWNSPVDAALRTVNSLSDGSSLRSLGSLPVLLYGCNHPDRVLSAPYEEYERHLLPEDMAERAAEMKFYLAVALDRHGLPAALMPSIAESVAKITFEAMRMSDTNDWSSAMKAFNAIDEKTIGKAIEGRK